MTPFLICSTPVVLYPAGKRKLQLDGKPSIGRTGQGDAVAPDLHQCEIHNHWELLPSNKVPQGYHVVPAQVCKRSMVHADSLTERLGARPPILSVFTASSSISEALKYNWRTCHGKP